MYITVLEALELQKDHSFLNVGSGSGYLSCLVAYILGANGLCHGIDINEAVVKHSQECIEQWLFKQQEANLIDNNGSSSSTINTISNGHHRNNSTPIVQDRISIIHGNAFDIDVSQTINCCKYDRIYVGAGCPDKYKSFFYSMLSDNGILIIPINEKNLLMKIKKHVGNVYTIKSVANVSFTPMVLSTQSLGFGVAAAAAALQVSSTPSLPMIDLPPQDVANLVIISPEELHINRSATRSTIKLPPILWAPSRARHAQYSTQFKLAVFNILLASSFYRVPEKTTTSTSSRDATFNCQTSLSVCGALPTYIWYYVLSFTTR